MSNQNDSMEAIITSLVNKRISVLKSRFLSSFDIAANPLIAEASARIKEKLEQVVAPCIVDQIESVPILPDGCVYYRKAGNRLVVVVQQPPQVRSLFFTKGLWKINEPEDIKKVGHGDYKPFRVALPYVVFILVFCDGVLSDNVACYYRNTPLSKLDDILCLPNLPNVHPSGDHVCLGNSGSLYGSVCEQIKVKIAYFWNSVFNGDHLAHFMSIREEVNSLRDIESWAEATKNDPLFVLQIKWHEHCSVKRAVDQWLSGKEVLGIGVQNCIKTETDKLVNQIADQLSDSSLVVENTNDMNDIVVQEEVIRRLDGLLRNCITEAMQNERDDIDRQKELLWEVLEKKLSRW